MWRTFFYSVIFLCTFTGGYLLVRRVACALFAVDRFECHFDTLFSGVSKQTIAAFIDQTAELKQCSLKQLAQLLLSTFPVIDKISCCFLSNNTVKLSFQACEPELCLNERWVLTNKDRVLPKELFALDAFSVMPIVQIGSGIQKEPSLSSRDIKSLRLLDRDFLNSYSVVWQSETQAWLHEKKVAGHSILFGAHIVPDKVAIAHCKQIERDLETKGMVARQGRRRYMFDVRFANQIILSADTGGRYG